MESFLPRALYGLADFLPWFVTRIVNRTFHFSHQVVRQLLDHTVVETGRKSPVNQSSVHAQVKVRKKLIWNMRALSWIGDDASGEGENSRWTGPCLCFQRARVESTKTTPRDGVA